MRRNIVLFLIFIVITLSPFSILAKGYLYIIGGGKRPNYMVKKIVELAGGNKSKIVIIPMASGVPLETALWQKYQFEKAGAGKVNFVIFSKETVDADSNLSVLDGATGIFFSGGDQSRLTKTMLNTKMLQKIRTIYTNGGVISGTSAGAAVMSKIMITGNELLNNDSTRNFINIQKGNIETVEGFGFIKKAIIDQHFVKRKRLNRLISLVLENPEVIGIGIDESTAILVNPDETFQVIGENTVLIYDATSAKNISTDKNGNLSAAQLKFHLLKSGDRFSLKEKRAL
ncbi:cyanophycinase [Calditrichota bacterium]